MSEFTLQDVVEKLGNMSVMELIALTRQLEQQWGVEAKPQVQAVNPQTQTQTGPTTEQTEFNVVLVSYPADKKMSVLKAVREATGLGLKEAKEFVEAVPKVVKEGVSKEDAAALQTTLAQAGGVVEVK